jgi:hypothetical protein
MCQITLTTKIKEFSEIIYVLIFIVTNCIIYYDLS